METKQELFTGFLWYSDLGYYMVGNDKPYKLENKTLNNICCLLNWDTGKDIFVYY